MKQNFNTEYLYCCRFYDDDDASSNPSGPKDRLEGTASASGYSAGHTCFQSQKGSQGSKAGVKHLKQLITQFWISYFIGKKGSNFKTSLFFQVQVNTELVRHLPFLTLARVYSGLRRKLSGFTRKTGSVWL